MKSLIVYASTHGSTAEVARFIGKTLQTHGFETRVAPIEHVPPLDDFDLIVVGSPVQNGMLLPPVLRFLKDQRHQLARQPLYVWANCIRVVEEGGYEHAYRYYLPHDLLAPLAPREVKIFPGKLNFDDMAWLEQETLRMRYDGAQTAGALSGDFRDWDIIGWWAKNIATTLLKV